MNSDKVFTKLKRPFWMIRSPSRERAESTDGGYQGQNTRERKEGKEMQGEKRTKHG